VLFFFFVLFFFEELTNKPFSPLKELLLTTISFSRSSNYVDLNRKYSIQTSYRSFFYFMYYLRKSTQLNGLYKIYVPGRVSNHISTLCHSPRSFY
jgi:hypothetical protein